MAEPHRGNAPAEWTVAWLGSVRPLLTHGAPAMTLGTWSVSPAPILLALRLSFPLLLETSAADSSVTRCQP